ncbi:MAG TPA: lactonase family protein [Cytophagaceae bacterium]|jgi:6-phosphogluconolactonase|nr:lactonase family protein [Cytophagaceae bacterium]
MTISIQNRLAVFALLLVVSVSCDVTGKKQLKKQAEDSAIVSLYVGTYTKKEGHVDGQGKGIYLMKMNEETGALHLKGIVSAITNPSFVTISTDRKNLYAVSETGPADGPNGFVYSYAINEDQSLTLLNKQSTAAYAPCHVNADVTGKYVFVANYSGGIAAMYKRLEDGSLSSIVDTIVLKNKKLNTESNPHAVILSPDNHFVFIPDKGADRIYGFKINVSKDRLEPTLQQFVELPKGSGPRHLVFHPNGKFAFVINELSNDIHTLAYNTTDGSLTDVSLISTLPADFKGKSYCADIHLHPNGKYIYGSNRGDNSIAAYRIDLSTGQLTLINIESTEGEFPRNFAISPNGNYLYAANQNSGTITHMKINPATGEVQSQHVVTEVKTPVCLDFFGKK